MTMLNSKSSPFIVLHTSICNGLIAAVVSVGRYELHKMSKGYWYILVFHLIVYSLKYLTFYFVLLFLSSVYKW